MPLVLDLLCNPFRVEIFFASFSWGVAPGYDVMPRWGGLRKSVERSFVSHAERDTRPPVDLNSYPLGAVLRITRTEQGACWRTRWVTEPYR